MNRFFVTIVLLSCSNVFMTFAWYGHLKNLNHRHWLVDTFFTLLWSQDYSPPCRRRFRKMSCVAD